MHDVIAAHQLLSYTYTTACYVSFAYLLSYTSVAYSSVYRFDLAIVDKLLVFVSYRPRRLGHTYCQRPNTPTHKLGLKQPTSSALQLYRYASVVVSYRTVHHTLHHQFLLAYMHSATVRPICTDGLL